MDPPSGLFGRINLNVPYKIPLGVKAIKHCWDQRKKPDVTLAGPEPIALPDTSLWPTLEDGMTNLVDGEPNALPDGSDEVLQQQSSSSSSSSSTSSTGVIVNGPIGMPPPWWPQFKKQEEPPLKKARRESRS